MSQRPPVGSPAALDTPLQHVLDIAREVSVDQLRQFAIRPSLELAAAVSRELPFHQHMTHILVSSADLELSFKTHFMLKWALSFTKTKLRGATPTERQAIDFMKEYCNVVAGKMKSTLEAVGLGLGQSLPFAIQGYNEIFYPRADAKQKHDAWALVDNGDMIHCSALITVRNEAVVPLLLNARFIPEAADETGEVELF